MAIEAVTFDFWNTIAAELPSGTMRDARLAAVLAACESHAAAVDAEEVGERLAELIRFREQSWANGEHHLSPVAGAERLVATLGLAGEVGEAVAEAFLNSGRDVRLALAPGIGDALERLRGQGLTLGIVCDAGFTGGSLLREFLAAEGLLANFSGWGFSDEVGVYKPDPRIFEAALGAIGAEPAAAAHVGDLRRTDVAGARAVGMTSVRYRALGDDESGGPEADFVIDSHDELPELVAELRS